MSENHTPWPQVAEKLGNAKSCLMDALKIAERSADAKLACQIGAVCARVEVLQNKASSKPAPKRQTLKQFARGCA